MHPVEAHFFGLLSLSPNKQQIKVDRPPCFCCALFNYFSLPVKLLPSCLPDVHSPVCRSMQECKAFPLPFLFLSNIISPEWSRDTLSKRHNFHFISVNKHGRCSIHKSYRSRFIRSIYVYVCCFHWTFLRNLIFTLTPVRTLRNNPWPHCRHHHNRYHFHCAPIHRFWSDLFDFYFMFFILPEHK